jgi:ribosomal protein S6--L-glutamate ligase
VSTVCFLLERGTPPRRSPIVEGVIAGLERDGIRVRVRYPEDELLRLDRLSVDADLYLLKSDTELALSIAVALERLGARVLNAAAASAQAKDKVVAAAVLHRAGVPAPRSLVARRPSQLAARLTDGALMLKPPRGYHGVGLAVAGAADALPAAEAYPDMVFAQRYLTPARTDLKVFGIGEDVFGVRKAFAADSFTRAGQPSPLAPDVQDIARRCGEAFGLALYGLDIAETDEGPSVVDVNYFPGYRGVPDAAGRLTDFIRKAIHDARA